MAVFAGPTPTDANGARAGATGYAPNVGVLPVQLGAPTTDAVGQQSAPMVTQSRISDTLGNAFGTTANPMATNQLVGTPVYATLALAAATGGNASLAAAAGKTTYINGFYVSVAHTSSATSAGQVVVSLDNGVTTHMNFTIAVSTTYPGLVEVNFPDPIPATAANTAIRVTCPTLANAGIGSISSFGYQL
jgi:hypothetical protein